MSEAGVEIQHRSGCRATLAMTNLLMDYTLIKVEFYMKRTFLITGATQGIGLATTQYLIQQGHTVIGIARNPGTSSFPGELFLADLADEKTAEQLFQEINQKYQVDGIINNVGMAIPGKIEEITLADFDKIINLNLKTALLAAQAFVKKMKENQWGRIINISSQAILGLDDRGVYAAAKAGLIGFTRSWALELASTGVTVNAVAPGPIETERYRKYRPVGSEAEKKSLANVPMGRIGQPGEIAATIAFLLSEDAGFITGQTLYVDGGGSIGRVSF